jgi:hypothetical protein
MAEQAKEETKVFTPLGTVFQEKVFQAMIVDKEWAKDFIEIFDVEACFDKPALRLLASKYIELYKDYKDFPSIETLTIAIADQFTRSKTDNPFKQQVANILAKASSNVDLQDLPWIKEKAFQFCKKQTIAGALNYCIDIIETDQVDKIVDVMRTAVNTATPTAPGHDYNNDLAARYSVVTRNPVPTLLPQFDDRKILNGGLGSGEVGIIVAPTGVGKCASFSTKITVKIKTIEKELTLAELFEMFGCEFKADTTIDISEFDIQTIGGDDQWHKINALYVTPEYQKYKITTTSKEILECADKHLLFTEKEWCYAENIKPGDKIKTKNNKWTIVENVIKTEERELMGDIEVKDVHSYYTNNLLSHNTHCLIHMGASGIKQGKNVFHYSFELNERYNGIRYDSHLTQIPSLDCFDSQKEIQKFLTDNKEILGRLIIKEFPARTIGLSTIRAHLDRECARLKIRPNLIIIDYAGLIRSSERYDLPRMEMQLVIQELRTFAKEYGVPIWTALQSNKEGAKSEIIDTTNMAESYGQAAEADFVFGLQRDNNMRESGYGNGFIAKNRMGVDGIKLKVHLDTARSTLRILSKEEQESLEQKIEEAKDSILEEKKASTLRSLKDKIRSLKNNDHEFVKIV